jgi:hypothetical protein
LFVVAAGVAAGLAGAGDADKSRFCSSGVIINM